MEAAFTIAIPFHTGLDYLKIAVESVLAQRQPSWRLLVFDDGGREQGVADLIESYADTRIAYHRNERNLGMVRNWNHALAQAPTDLVALLHADDRLLPDYTELMLELAGRHTRAVAFFCGAVIIDARGRRRFSVPDAAKGLFVPHRRGPIVLRGEAALRDIMRGNFIMCPTLCYRKSILRERRFAEEWKQVQDLELTSRLLMDGELLVGTRAAAYAYRRHPESATSRQSESLLRFEEEYRLFDAIAERADRLGWMQAAATARRKTIVKLHLGYRALRSASALDWARARAYLRLLAGRR